MKHHRIGKEAYGIISLFLLLIGCSTRASQEAPEEVMVHIQAHYLQHMETSKSWLDSMQVHETWPEWQADYRAAREAFKRAEPLLAFLEINNYRTLNAPNILKVEEEDLTDIKIFNPTGFQVLEETLFAEETPDMAFVHKHAQKTAGRLNLIIANTDFSRMKSYHLLWAIRDAVVRVATTGVTGFDSPGLQQSLQEGQWVYESLGQYLNLAQPWFSAVEHSTAWQAEIEATIEALDSDFEAFDRYTFLRKHIQQQMSLWQSTVKDWGVVFPFDMAIRNEAPGLFSDSTFSQAFFADPKASGYTAERAQLGELLFHDTGLSASGSMSCGTCHQPKLAFTDGLAIAQGQTRNSPTLTYAGLQQQLFYDNRAGSLEGQIVAVVKNETEFHSDLQGMEAAVKDNPAYVAAFREAFGDSVRDVYVREAIAHYIRSLAPFDSRFDRAMQGEEELLSESEIRGFNLFAGKAQCATCHFAPVFNGTVPPDYKDTEMELLGVPNAPDTLDAEIDEDPGRYNLYGTESRRYFFKTPTIRNVALTAPYMHNGVYTTLEEVVDFYDRGGGAGLGLDLQHQTLPTDPLHLSDQEKDDLAAFMRSLTDRRYENAPLP